MANTKLLTVNNTGDPESVTVQTVCREIIIGEDHSVGGWPTTDYIVRAPLKTSDAVQIQAGKFYAITSPPGRFFEPGDVPLFVETVSGTTTFFVDEH